MSSSAYQNNIFIMNKSNFSKKTFSHSTVTCVHWVCNGTKHFEESEPGTIAGFEKYFQNSSKQFSSLMIGLDGSHSTETVQWLKAQAEKSHMIQFVREVKIKLNYSHRERINGVGDDGMPVDEFDLSKSTTQLKRKLTEGWVDGVLRCENFDVQTKIDLLTAASSGDINQFLPISAGLFSHAVETMQEEIKNPKVIFFPAVPLAVHEWKGNPAKLVAFSPDAIVQASESYLDH
jgi:hypothetical protein